MNTYRVETLWMDEWIVFGKCCHMPRLTAIAWAAECKRHGEIVRIVNEQTGDVSSP